MKIKSIFGMIISILLISYMIVVLIITNFVDVEEKYPSGMIKDQSGKLPYNVYDIDIEKNKRAPDFELLNLSGEKVRLSDYRGKKVFLNFWATWCGPCEIEMPHMESFYKRNKDLENVEIIAVNMTKSEANVENVREFANNYGLTFPVLLDNKGEIEDLYKIISYPSTYLINEDGILISGFIGSVNNEEKVKELVDSIK